MNYVLCDISVGIFVRYFRVEILFLHLKKMVSNSKKNASEESQDITLHRLLLSFNGTSGYLPFC